MFTAITLLMRSLDPGVNEATIQFATARKFCSFFFNYWNMPVKGSQLDMVAKLIIMPSPMNKHQFEHFLKEMHCRMGDAHHPDLDMSIEIMVELMNQFEQDWRAVKKNQRVEGTVEGRLPGSVQHHDIVLCSLERGRGGTFVGFGWGKRPPL
jgi:hypothetical protein